MLKTFLSLLIIFSVIKIYNEVNNYFYEIKIDQMEENNELSIQIESIIKDI